MVWTKLLHVDLPRAIKPQFVEGKWHRSIISSRYKNLLRREFQIAGCPWIYENKEAKKNPRHKLPKGKKWMLDRPMRLAKIKKAMEEADDKLTEYRQNRLNNRKFAVLDKVVHEVMPSVINMKRSHRSEDGESESVGHDLKTYVAGRKGPKYSERNPEKEKAISF